MKKLFSSWNGLVNEISSSVSERDCKKYGTLYAVVAIILAIAGRKNKWYFIGTALYAAFSAALFQSAQQQRRERWEKEFEKELNEPVEK